MYLDLSTSIERAKEAKNECDKNFEVTFFINPEFSEDGIRRISLFADDFPKNDPYLLFENGKGNNIVIMGSITHEEYFVKEHRILSSLIKEYGSLIGEVTDIDMSLDQIVFTVKFNLGSLRIPIQHSVIDDDDIVGMLVMIAVENTPLNLKTFLSFASAVDIGGEVDFTTEEKMLCFVKGNDDILAYNIGSENYMGSFKDPYISHVLSERGRLFGALRRLVGYNDDYLFYQAIISTNLDVDDIETDDLVNEEFEEKDDELKSRNGQKDILRGSYVALLSNERTKPIKNGNIILSVVGMKYRDNYKELMDSLLVGTEVTVRQDFGNKYDDEAWGYYLNNGSCIGYVPKDEKPFAKSFLKNLEMKGVICKIEGDWIDAKFDLTPEMVDSDAIKSLGIMLQLVNWEKNEDFCEKFTLLTVEQLLNYIKGNDCEDPQTSYESVEIDKEVATLSNVEKLSRNETNEIEFTLFPTCNQIFFNKLFEGALLFLCRANENSDVSVYYASAMIGELDRNISDALRDIVLANKPVPCYVSAKTKKRILVSIPSEISSAYEYLSYVFNNCLTIGIECPTIEYVSSIKETENKQQLIDEINEIERVMNENDDNTCQVYVTPDIKSKGVFLSRTFGKNAYYLPVESKFIPKHMTETGHGLDATITSIDKAHLLDEGAVNIYFEITFYKRYSHNTNFD